jgi:hypothetical protein
MEVMFEVTMAVHRNWRMPEAVPGSVKAVWNVLLEGRRMLFAGQNTPNAALTVVHSALTRVHSGKS